MLGIWFYAVLGIAGEEQHCRREKAKVVVNDMRRGRGRLVKRLVDVKQHRRGENKQVWMGELHSDLHLGTDEYVTNRSQSHNQKTTFTGTSVTDSGPLKIF